MNDKITFDLSQKFITVCVCCLGSLLLVLSGCLTYFSSPFDYNHAVFDMPVIELALGLVLAGCIYLPLLPLIRKLRPESHPLHYQYFAFAILIGLAMRLVLVPSEPVLEDDYQRYLWDGAVTAHGFNPYRFAPIAINSTPGIPAELSKLSAASGPVIERINHPELRTIYPTVAQAFFALSYWINPWSITTWKLILLIMDLFTLCLLLILLKEAGLSWFWSLLYWWNPVVLKELFNSGHMDGILIPFVLVAVLFSIKRFYWQSSVVLAFAAGVKVWPALLLPLLLRPIWQAPKDLVKCLVIFSVVVAALFAPVVLSGPDASSGLLAYARNWKTNSALTPAIEHLTEQILNITGTDVVSSSLLARLTLAALILTALVLVCSAKMANSQDMLRRVSILTTAMFFLSPAQFPWYLMWVLPYMCFFPIYGVYILTATIPIYYLAFYLYPRELDYVFSNALVWIIWLPAWSLLAIQAYSTNLRGNLSAKSSPGEPI